MRENVPQVQCAKCKRVYSHANRLRALHTASLSPPSLSLEAENVYADCSRTAYGACGDRWRIESSRSMVGGFLYAYCSLCSFRRKLRGLVDDCAYEHPKGYLYHYYESSQCAYVSINEVACYRTREDTNGVARSAHPISVLEFFH